jgi:hypothetical protein
VLWYVASRSDRDNVNMHGVTLDAGLDGELHGKVVSPEPLEAHGLVIRQ